MRHLVVLLFAFVTGCTAQIPLYPSDTFPVFPVRITRPRNPQNSERDGPNTAMVLDAHVQTQKELQEVNRRLNITNDVIEMVKRELKDEIAQLRNELVINPGGNIQVGELNKQLEETKVTVANLTTEIAVNSQLLIDSMAAIGVLEAGLADTKKTVNTNMEETKLNFDLIKERLSATENSLTDAVNKIGNLEIGVNVNSQLVTESLVAIESLNKEINSIVNQMVNDANVNLHLLRESISEIENSLTETANKLEKTKTEFAEIQTVSAKNSDEIDLLSEKLRQTNSAIENLRADFGDVKQNLTDTNVGLGQLTESFTDLASPKSIGKMPASCADLKTTGHVKSGVFSVMGGKSVVNVYCDFTLDGTKMEKLIGHVDVKTSPIYFSVERSSSFTSVNTKIPFEFSQVNVGGAMDLATGIFTAPVSGVYSFTFHGLAEFQASNSSVPFMAVGLFVNDERVALALTEESNTRISSTGRGQRSPLSLSTTVQLTKGDQVWLNMFSKSSTVSLYDNSNRHSDFSGWLIEENISQ